MSWWNESVAWTNRNTKIKFGCLVHDTHRERGSRAIANPTRPGPTPKKSEVVWSEQGLVLAKDEKNRKRVELVMAIDPWKMKLYRPMPRPHVVPPQGA